MVQVLRQYVIVILVTASLALLVRLFALEAFRIPSDFMAPTLQSGDIVFVNKLAYGFRFPPNGMATSKLKSPEHGDVVVYTLFADTTKDYIKRVIAVPGDTVEIKANQIFLNGKIIEVRHEKGLNEERLNGRKYFIKWGSTESNMPAAKVPAGHVFVLGDDRTQGSDSRVWGFLPFAGLKGRASVIWYSQNRSRIMSAVE